MKRRKLLYPVASAFGCIIVLFIILSNRQAARYTDLLRSASASSNSFRNLSRLLDQPQFTNDSTAFTGPKNSNTIPGNQSEVVKELNILQQVEDAPTSAIVAGLNSALQPWLSQPEKLGSSLRSGGSAKHAGADTIKALLVQGTSRATLLLDTATNGLARTMGEQKQWIAAAFILLVALLVYSVLQIVRSAASGKPTQEALQPSARLLQAAHRIAGLGSWRYDIAKDSMNWSDEMYTIWGIEKNTPVSYQSFLSSIHPDYRDLFSLPRLASWATQDADSRYQILLPDHTTRWIHQLGMVTGDANGRAAIVEGTVRDITDQQAAEAASSENAFQHSLLSLVVKSSDDAIISKTLTGIITTWNKGAEAIFGYSSAEVIGKHISLLIPSERLNEEDGIIARISAGKHVEHYETERLTKDGRRIIVSLSVSPVRDAKGTIIGASKIARDITGEKRFRDEILQNEIKYRALFENSLDAILLTLQSGEVLAANPAACEIFGMTEAEICAMGRAGLMQQSDPRLPAFLEERASTGKSRGEFTFVRKGGETFQGEQTSSLFTDSSGLAKACVILRDISERKKAAAALEKSEKRFRTLIENNNDIICLMDASFRVVYRSPSAVRITGWTNTEMEHADARKNIHPDDLEQADQIVKNILLNPGVPVNTLFRNRHKDGRYLWVEGVLNNLLLDENVNAIVFNFRDVTERLEAQTALAKNEKQFRALIENDEGIIAMLDENLHPVYRSPSAERVTGYNDQDMEDGVSIQMVHPDDMSSLRKHIREMRANPAMPVFCTYRIMHKKGHYIWLEGTFTNLIKDPEIKAIVVNMRDITKRKQAEEKLSASELHYRSLIEQANDAIYMANGSFEYIDINPSATKMLGYSKEEFLQLSPAKIIFEEDLRNNAPKLQQLRAGKAITLEQRFKRKDGEKVNVEVNAKRMEDGSFMMIARDITARLNEELQKQLVAEISKVFNESPDLSLVLAAAAELLAGFADFAMAEIWLVGKDQQRINLVTRYPENGALAAFGQSPGCIRSFSEGQGLPGKCWQTKQVQFQDNLPLNPDFVRRVAAGKAGLHAAYGIPLLFNHAVIGVLLLGLTKATRLDRAFTASFTNLGAHLGAEIERKQLEQELSQLFNFAPDIICIAGTDGYFKKVNPAASTLLGYTAEELLAVPFTNFIHPDDRASTINGFRQMAAGSAALYFENRCITKSGKIKWFAWTSSLSQEEGLIFSVAKDITVKKELGNLLTKVNALARMGGWEIDLLTGSVYWTDMVKEIHEVDPAYTPDLAAALSFYKDDGAREMIGEKIRQSVEFGKPWDEELQITTGKGNQRWIRTIGETEFVQGKCVRIYGSFQDIDQRKKAEIGLQQTVKSLEDYKFALDQSSIISVTERTGKISHVNDNLVRVSKYSRDELVGSRHDILHSNHHPEEFFAALWRTIESGKVWRNEIKNRAKDGSYFWVDTTIVPFLDSDNQPLQYLAIGFDVTSKRSAIENELRVLAEKNTILESIGDAFFAVDNNWLVTYWNHVAERILQRPKNEMMGQSLWNLFPAAVESESYQKYNAAMLTGNVAHFETYHTAQDAWYEISAYPSDNGLSVYFKDITYRKLSEIRLRQLNEDLNEQTKQLAYSNKELEQFAYVASHDLQEPLRMITSFLTKLEQKYEGVFDETGKKYINFAVDGARRMRRIILDLLEFSRVGRAGEGQECFDLNEIINEVNILYSKQIEEKKAVIGTSQLPVVTAYKAPLRQVFQNLISNALKYSKNDVPPHITISAIEKPGCWEFSIADNGIGIEREYFDKIFVIFQRLHKKDEYSGTGMGLAITKKIIENLGGSIWLESREGEGSTFYFTVIKTDPVC